jgi:enamine deaminase RidA (YjgF/YER057c/UK114 family)
VLLLSGVTGTKADGTVAADPAEQFEQAFEHLRLYLAAAGAGFEDIAAGRTGRAARRRSLAGRWAWLRSRA